MPTSYSIVQYVPDPIIDERINVGVVVVAGPRVRARFLSDWSRAARFGSVSVTYLKDFARQIREAAAPQIGVRGIREGLPLTENRLHEMAEHWVNTIQVTKPRASTLEPDELIDVLVARYLREPPHEKRVYRDRKTAAALTVRAVQSALEGLAGGPGRDLVRPRHVVMGEFDQHRLDVVVGNGRPAFAAHAISLEVPQVKRIEPTLDRTAWIVDDVRRRDPTIPLGILVLEPKPYLDDYDERIRGLERARRIFAGLRANVVSEYDVQEWASVTARNVLDLRV